MIIEALKEAKSVIGSINSGKANALTIGGETVYWQREEWVRWALDEVLPQLEKAIDAAEKQEPAAQCMKHGECFGGKCIYTHPQPNSEFVGVLETLLRALENEQDRNRLEDVRVDATDAAVLLGRQYLGLVNKQEGVV